MGEDPREPQGPEPEDAQLETDSSGSGAPMLQDQRSPRCCVRYLEELRGGPAKSLRAAACQGACGPSRR